MADSYLVRKKVKIRRQQGDTGSIVFTVPAALSISGMTVLFQVRDSGDYLIFRKSSLDSTIIISDQTITVNLTGSETLGNEGIFDWELEIYDSNDIITIGKGVFEIIKQISRPETISIICTKSNLVLELNDVILTYTEA